MSQFLDRNSKIRPITPKVFTQHIEGRFQVFTMNILGRWWWRPDGVGVGVAFSNMSDPVKALTGFELFSKDFFLSSGCYSIFFRRLYLSFIGHCIVFSLIYLSQLLWSRANKVVNFLYPTKCFSVIIRRYIKFVRRNVVIHV